MLTSAVTTTISQREMKCCSQTDGQYEPPCHPSTVQINSSGLKTTVGSRNVVSVRFCKTQLRWNVTFLYVAGLMSHFMLWRHRAYGLVGFKHKNYFVRVWKRSSGSQRLPKKMSVTVLTALSPNPATILLHPPIRKCDMTVIVEMPIC